MERGNYLKYRTLESNAGDVFSSSVELDILDTSTPTSATTSMLPSSVTSTPLGGVVSHYGGSSVRQQGMSGCERGGGSISVTQVVRKEAELNEEERRYLLSVERGDIPSVQQCLQNHSGALNKNCVDPLGRTALLIAIENDNIELIEVLLRARVELRDALLHAINEDNVEATQLLLKHELTCQTVISPLDNVGNKEKAAKITDRWKKLTTRKDPVSGSAGAGTSVANRLLHHHQPLSSSASDAELRPSTDDIRQTNTDNYKITQSLTPPSPGPAVHSSSFTPDITPIILAAHRDNYEIIKILLDRGDSIVKPHDVRCSCDDCVSKSAEDSLNHSLSRINAYRALASPSLMALSSRDPILTAFELSWELRLLSRLENELKLEYEQLSKQCRNFAVDLLDQVRGSKELEVLLNYDRVSGSVGGVDDHVSSGGDGGGGDKMNLARLKLAIKYKQKRFVAHANCQQLLASLWYEGLLGFRRRHIVFKVLLTVSVSLLFPVLSVVYMIAPKSWVGQIMRRPFIKFICHSSSYMTFLFLLILASQRIESIIIFSSEAGTEEMTDSSLPQSGDRKMTREVRGAPPTSIEWMILAYVLGLIWAEVKQLWDQGVKSYVHDMWNILDFITNSLYIATYTLKLVAYLRVEEEKRRGDPMATISREHWHAYDPTLISEGFFAAANIFSSLKLIYIFTVNPHLGPLQISLGRMVIDIMKFLFIALLVCFSYSCGVNQLYWYYAEARSRECVDCELRKSMANESIAECPCERALANLFEIIQTLYFAIYGLVEIRNFELKERHEFTQFVGKLMYGTYLGIMTIVLINMFIAMLSSSFQKISNDADTEWKFARSRLWMSYFDEGGTVPAPFNIIPTPKTFFYILLWFWERLCRCSKKARSNKWQSIRRAMKKKSEKDQIYEAVIHDLIKRYVMKRQRATNAEGVSEDDLNEIKQDISSFRYELLQVLKSNGMKLPAEQNSGHQTSSSGKQRRKGSRMSMNKLCSRDDNEANNSHQSYLDQTTITEGHSVPATPVISATISATTGTVPATSPPPPYSGAGSPNREGGSSPRRGAMESGDVNSPPGRKMGLARLLLARQRSLDVTNNVVLQTLDEEDAVVGGDVRSLSAISIKSNNNLIKGDVLPVIEDIENVSATPRCETSTGLIARAGRCNADVVGRDSQQGGNDNKISYDSNTSSSCGVAWDVRNSFGDAAVQLDSLGGSNFSAGDGSALFATSLEETNNYRPERDMLLVDITRSDLVVGGSCLTSRPNPPEASSVEMVESSQFDTEGQNPTSQASESAHKDQAQRSSSRTSKKNVPNRPSDWV